MVACAFTRHWRTRQLPPVWKMLSMMSQLSQMNVAEFVERQNSSPANGETPLHAHITPTNNNNNVIANKGSINCISASRYLFLQHNLDISAIPRDGNIISSPETTSIGENYSPKFDVSSHFQRRCLFRQRKRQEFIPANKKDKTYWERRRRNNESAKRSREKHVYNDMILEHKVLELSKENHILKAQLAVIKDKYGISGESVVNVEQVMASCPTNDEILRIIKSTNSSTPPVMYRQSSLPIPPPIIYRTANTGPSSPIVPIRQVFNPVSPALNPPVLEAAGNSLLNLSRSRPIEFSISKESPLASGSGEVSLASNKSLPHKLRHKSLLNDEKVAVTALLSLHNINKEAPFRARPPWDG
ncbi:unnamed protein product [Nezara viridula]|uniref:BZIP domain-containing protein n=1 Tax=Nezara viridula TaxID=85310 RepID=A0A9P0E9B1_NEZVI|nr:unnamed protein product [Nezara viridula]